MGKARLACISMMVLALLPASCAVASCTGRVFLAGGDVRTGAGLPGVLVSDGRQVVATGADGRYVLADPVGASVFVVKPAQLQVPKRADGLPAFWRNGCGDLSLQADDAAHDDTRVLVFSDPQAGTPVQVDYYRRDIVHSAAGHDGFQLGLTLGDISDDAPALYPALNAATASLGVPWLHLPGNHDIDVDARSDEDSLHAYAAVYGPDTFAWEEANATFVALDNVIALPGQRPAYVGGLRGDQFAFLEAYLPHAPRDRLLVVAAHIPWFDTARPGSPHTMRPADRERLFALLEEFPHVLLLSGHRHTQRQFFHGADSGWHGAQPLREYNVGAASGAFWSGVMRDNGVPDATMADGTPNGYATLVVQPGGQYALDWHPAKQGISARSMTSKMSLHAPRVLRRGAYPAWGIYANVFMGHDGTRVEFRIDGGEWRPMRQVAAPDPALLVENALDDISDTLRGFDRSPEAEPSMHLWRGALATDLDAGQHTVEVRAFDDRGGEHRAQTTYRLQEWAP